jgi:hypothetical protein
VKLIDYAWARPDPATLKAEGFSGVLRYLSWLPNGKVIDRNELDRLLAAGLDVVLNWEYGTTDGSGGSYEGTGVGREATRQATELGYPVGATLPFSIDRAVSADTLPPIVDYFTALRPIVLGSGYRLGCYSGYWLLKELFNRQLIDDGWQTFAWSSGLWEPRATLRQVQNNITAGGVTAAGDLDLVVGVGPLYTYLHPYKTGETRTMVIVVHETGACWFVWADNATGKLYRRYITAESGQLPAYENLTNRSNVGVFAADLDKYGVDVATLPQPPVVTSVASGPVLPWTGTFTVSSAGAAQITPAGVVSGSAAVAPVQATPAV